MKCSVSRCLRLFVSSVPFTQEAIKTSPESKNCACVRRRSSTRRDVIRTRAAAITRRFFSLLRYTVPSHVEP